MSKSKKKPAAIRATPVRTAQTAKVSKAKKTAVDAPAATEKPVTQSTTKRAAWSPLGILKDDQWLNKWLAVLFGVQALTIVLFSANVMFPVVTQFIGVDTFATATAAGKTVYAVASHRLFSVSLAQLLGMALAISAAFHALMYYMPQVYQENVKSRQNPLRWLENAFSASLLPLAIGLVVGVRDITALAMMFTLGFLVHVLGWQLEQARAQGDETAVRRSFILMIIAGAVVWVGLGLYLLNAMLFGDGLPVFLISSYLVTVAGVLWYGWIIRGYVQRQGRWQDYAVVNRSCVLLGFAIKTLLVWQLFAGILRP